MSSSIGSAKMPVHCFAFLLRATISPQHRWKGCAEQSRYGGESIGNGPAGPAPRFQ
jgi:hypothetical protein